MRKKKVFIIPLLYRLRKMRIHCRRPNCRMKPFTSKCTKSDVSISHAFPHFRVHPVCEETLAPFLILHSRQGQGQGVFVRSLAIEI